MSIFLSLSLSLYLFSFLQLSAVFIFLNFTIFQFYKFLESPGSVQWSLRMTLWQMW